jgi:hypothetical protein
MDGETSIGRRKLLVGAGAGLGALALASVPAVASADPERKGKGGLTGSWLLNTTFTTNNPAFPAPPPSTDVNSFAAGGVFSLLVLGPGGGFPALGTWESTGDHSFRVTLWQSVPVPNGPTFAVRAIQIGSFSGDQMEATSTYELFFASDLKTVVSTGTSTSSGHPKDGGGRISA